MMTKWISLGLCFGSMAFGQVNIKGGYVNSTKGFQYNSAAPGNQVLCGNGTVFLPTATCNFYIQSNGSTLPQEPYLNFSSYFSLSDTSPSTTVTLGPAAFAASLAQPAKAFATTYIAGGLRRFVSITITDQSACSVEAVVNGANYAQTSIVSGGGYNGFGNLTFIVPPNASYSAVHVNGNCNQVSWTEVDF